MSFQVGGYNPYSQFQMSPEQQQLQARYQAMGIPPTYPQQFPMGGTFTPSPYQMPSFQRPVYQRASQPNFGMQDMMKMFMMLMMQLLLKHHGDATPKVIDGSKGPVPNGTPGGYGTNAAINVLDAARDGQDIDKADIKYSDKAANNLDNALAFSKEMLQFTDRNGDGKLSSEEVVGRMSNNGKPATAEDFATVDRNKDGYVDAVEMAAKRLVQDANNDGTWTVDEGKAFAKLSNDEVGTKMDKLIADNKLYDKNLDLSKNSRLFNANATFLKTDKNDDGFLSKEELGPENKKMFKGDVNADGKIDRVEYLGQILAMDEDKDWSISKQEIINQAPTIFEGTDEYAKERVEKAIQDFDLVNVIADWLKAH